LLRAGACKSSLNAQGVLSGLDFVLPAYSLFSGFACVLLSVLGGPSVALCFDLAPFVRRVALSDAQILQHCVGVFAMAAQGTWLYVLPLLFMVGSSFLVK